MKIRNTDKFIFNLVGYPIILIIAILCVIPLELVVASSFASADSINTIGYSFIPKSFSLASYAAIFRTPSDLINAYGVTMFSTVVGTIGGLYLTAMTAYVLWRKDFAWRNQFSFFFYFTVLFSGGLVPWYILCVHYLKFKDIPMVAIILPALFSVFNIIIMRNFMKSIPDAIIESAKIDGAGDFLIFNRLVLPLAKPALASIGLFIALSYWNDWYMSLMFVSDIHNVQLQYYLYKIISSVEALNRLGIGQHISLSDLPTEGMKMAMTVIVIGPIVLLYPFLQKYFVKGLTIGSVKG
jgi:putative aldouronate transport system permease protein